MSETDWSKLIKEWFPGLIDRRLRQVTWPDIDQHRDYIKSLLGTVTVSTIHQRLRDEHKLQVSISSFRRWVHATLPDEVAKSQTDAGRRQAALSGERLRGVPLAAIHNGPLTRAEQTARLVGEQLDGVPCRRSEAAGDYLPYLPTREELPPEAADTWIEFLHQFRGTRAGPGLAAAALTEFTGTVVADEPRHELVVTHNFLVGWLVRAALDAPKWRWLGINHANAALTVIRYSPDRPPAVLVFNDTGHLPAELRWTGFPQDSASEARE